MPLPSGSSGPESVALSDVEGSATSSEEIAGASDLLGKLHVSV